MPWTDTEATQHTRAASTPALKRLWAKVANASYKKHGDDTRAIKEANAAVARAKEQLRLI